LAGQASYMKTDRDRIDILIVSAHLPELSGLRSILGDSFQANVGGREVVATAVGIGVPGSACGMAFELCRHAPRAVILVGTSGAYRGRNLAIGQVVVGRRLYLVSAVAASGKGAFPAPMPVLVETDPALRAALSDRALHEVDVATTLAITTDDTTAATLSGSVDADVEHLEAFGVATACARQGVEFGVVLGIANVVGSTARKEWAIHHESAGHAAAAIVADWIVSGAGALKK
jgi:nucleoside phosphorylase